MEQLPQHLNTFTEFINGPLRPLILLAWGFIQTQKFGWYKKAVPAMNLATASVMGLAGLLSALVAGQTVPDGSTAFASVGYLPAAFVATSFWSVLGFGVLQTIMDTVLATGIHSFGKNAKQAMTTPRPARA